MVMFFNNLRPPSLLVIVNFACVQSLWPISSTSNSNLGQIQLVVVASSIKAGTSQCRDASALSWKNGSSMEASRHRASGLLKNNQQSAQLLNYRTPVTLHGRVDGCPHQHCDYRAREAMQLKDVTDDDRMAQGGPSTVGFQHERTETTLIRGKAGKG